MNKSIVLVMCDILVLSAMSLSNGGLMTGESDVCCSQVDDDAVFVTKAEFDDLERLAAAKKKEAADADAKRKVAEADAARARTEAETAKQEETVARNAAEAARKDEARARSEAELARAAEASAKAEAEQARARAAAAQNEADEMYKELADIKRRQRMLNGEIPAGIAQKLQFQLVRKKEWRTLYSPLLKIEDQCYALFEIDRLGIDNVDCIANVVVGMGCTNSFCSVASRLESNPNLYFIHITNADQSCSIQCGVESPSLEGNLVFYVEKGECHGNPVPCSIDAERSFSCSVKTESRTIFQQMMGQGHSVYEGCFLLSAKCGALLGIVRGKSRIEGQRKCDLIKPTSKQDLIPLSEIQK